MVTFSDSVLAGSCPQESVITRTWTGTDACGNVTEAVQTITVQDTLPPALDVTQDALVGCADDVSDPGNTGGFATATDDCDPVAEVTFTDVEMISPTMPVYPQS